MVKSMTGLYMPLSGVTPQLGRTPAPFRTPTAAPAPRTTPSSRSHRKRDAVDVEQLYEDFLSNDISFFDENYDPEEVAAQVFGMAYDDLGFPVEWKKELMVTHEHGIETVEISELLKRILAARGQIATVATDLGIFWNIDQPRKRTISPDVVVIKGVELMNTMNAEVRRGLGHRSYRAWENGNKFPDFALEISSLATAKHDVSTKAEGKLTKYNKSGVAEYVVYDPLGKLVSPPLQMWRRVNGQLEPLTPGIDGRFWSESLELSLGLEHGKLTFYDRDGSKFLRLTEYLAEESAKQEAALQKAQAEQERAESEKREKELAMSLAETERREKQFAMERADTERQKKEQAQARFEAERTRAEAERTRAEAERTRAEAERTRAEVEKRARESAVLAAESERERAEAERREKERAISQANALAARIAELEQLMAGGRMF